MTETGVRYVGEAGERTTIPEILRRRAEMTPDARFFTLAGESRTYAEMLAAAERTAGALSSLGLGRGSKVATLLPNCTEILDLWFGAALLGAVFVPVNVGLRGEGLGYVVEHSEAEFIALNGALIDTLDRALPVGRGPRHRYVRGEEESSGYGNMRRLVEADHPEPVLPSVTPDELASIVYTSGTTGLPKGVMNCHNAFGVAANEFTRRYVRVRADDVMFTSLPLFHVNAQMTTTLGALVSGRPAVIAPRFSASAFFDEIRAHEATVFNAIGAMLTILHKQPRRPDDAQNPVRLVMAAATPAELWRPFEERFDLTLHEIYGLTESATFCLGAPPDDIRVGKIGKPVSWSEVRIIGPDESELPDGEAGEIAIRGKQPDTMFSGYFKNSEATAKAMRGGWFHTGDRGRRDPDGQFEFVDRLKDCIRRRGENVSSFEVERIVNGHDSIRESAAVGIPSELGEEDIMIVVVARGDGIEAEGLIDYCRERMAAFMVPRYVLVVDQLPKTATQRVEKYQLRDRGAAGAWDREAQGRK